MRRLRQISAFSKVLTPVWVRVLTVPSRLLWCFSMTGPRSDCLMQTIVQTLTKGLLGCSFLCTFTLLTLIVIERGNLLCSSLSVDLWTSLVIMICLGRLATLLLNKWGFLGSNEVSMRVNLLMPLFLVFDMGMKLSIRKFTELVNWSVLTRCDVTTLWSIILDPAIVMMSPRCSNLSSCLVTNALLGLTPRLVGRYSIIILILDTAASIRLPRCWLSSAWG